MKHATRFATSALAVYGLLFAVASEATNVATKPLRPEVLVKPNVIFAWDDSGSTDWELMLDSNSGVMWWDTATNRAFQPNGRPLVTGSGGNQHSYLFPVSNRLFGDGDGNGRTVPPTAQFAALRSSTFNPIYYDPNAVYRPWVDGHNGTTTMTFGNASPTAARTQPTDTGNLFNLTVNQTTPNIYIQRGMRRPDNQPATGNENRSYTYFPATYWAIDASCVVDDSNVNSNCVTAPDGRRLRRVEIKPANYPSTAAYDAAIQNFANWFTYYRKRKLMAQASMGAVLEDLTGMRLGMVPFNNHAAPTMYDTDATGPANNARRLLGRIYSESVSGGTPTAATLNYVGNQYLTNNNVIQYSCQRNNAFVVTDGFANGNTQTPPAYNAATYGSNVPPFTTTTPGWIADVALSYYTNNLRNGRLTLVDGRVPAGDPTAVNPDTNTNLHMNTYGISLGVRGTVWPMPSGQTPFSNPFTWPTPANDTPTAIDDLFHATLNGRGQMYMATNPTELAVSIQDGLNDMLSNVGAQASVAVSSVNLRRGDGRAYLGIYNPKGWTGDVTANPVNPANGQIAVNPSWSAATRLLAKDWNTRIIVTSVNGVGRPFTAGQIGPQVNPGGAYGSDAAVVNYLRGDRSGETAVPALFRRRLSLMGAVLNARPAVDPETRVVYAASSEGMVHAVDADNGEELWAYVPGSALSEMGAQTSRTWTFETYLDGSPQLFIVGSRKILIGGRGAAGGGYYAIDVTSPRSLPNTQATAEATLASRVLWELPGSQQSPAITTAGLAMGQPMVVNTSAGPMALLTQGYNGAADGNGRLYMLNPLTGALVHTFAANNGGGIDPGLSQVNALVENDGTVRYVYGGDEQGNVWRFDLQGRGAPLRIATLTDASGNRQPVTAKLTLVRYRGSVVVLVGTGRLLHQSDFDSNRVQSIYAIKDTGTTLANPRAGLVPRTLGAEAGGERDLSGAAFNWVTDRGWYFDLPVGQHANTDLATLFGVVAFTTNEISMTGCASASFFYAVDIVTGLNPTPASGITDSYTAVRIGDFTVSSVMAVGYDGTGSRDFGFIFQRSSTRTGVGGTDGRPSCEAGSSACTSEPNFSLPPTKRKNAWRQIQRD